MSASKKKILIAVLAIILVLAAALAYFQENIVFNIQDGQEIAFEYGQENHLPEVEAKHQRMFGLFSTQIKDLEMTGSVGRELGSYPIIWKAKAGKVEKQVTLNVKVVDTMAPSITLVESPDHFTDYGDEYEEDGYSAFDLHDGDLSDKVVATSDGTTVTYTVSDQSGNEAIATRTILYKDMSAPEIVLKGEDVVSVLKGDTYTEPGFTAIDKHDGDLSAAVSVSGSVDTSKAGTYQITYAVSDAAGNKAETIRTVMVYVKQSNNPSTSGKVVYLTFDDGPSGYDRKLLNVLDKYNVKVTFFVTGNREECRSYITEAASKGHTIALHSYSHNYAKCYTSLEGYWEDLNKLNDLVYELTGKRSKLVRLPGGSSNTVSKKYCKGIMTEVCNSLTENGYRYTDWNVSSGDAGGTTDPDKVASNVINGMKKHKVSIVLQHDTKDYSVAAVEKIIVWGLANGYTFLPMTDSSPVVQHAIHN